MNLTFKTRDLAISIPSKEDANKYIDDFLKSCVKNEEGHKEHEHHEHHEHHHEHHKHEDGDTESVCLDRSECLCTEPLHCPMSAPDPEHTCPMTVPAPDTESVCTNHSEYPCPRTCPMTAPEPEHTCPMSVGNADETTHPTPCPMSAPEPEPTCAQSVPAPEGTPAPDITCPMTMPAPEGPADYHNTGYKMIARQSKVKNPYYESLVALQEKLESVLN